jgi:hypothetical protein
MDIDDVLPSAYQRSHSHASLAALMQPVPTPVPASKSARNNGSGRQQPTGSRTATGKSSAPAVTSPLRGGSETTQEFIMKKRELFLVALSMENKEQEIDRLETEVRGKQEKLATVEMTLEADALRFDKFLKTNDKIAHDALRKQEQLTRDKIEAAAEIRRLQNEVSKVELDIGKLQEQLSDSIKYKTFLDGITPADHAATQSARREARRAERQARVAAAAASGKFLDDAELADEDAYGGDGEPYYTQPQQLTDLMNRLEERNLFLIQNYQETEEAVEELRQKFTATAGALQQQTHANRQSLDEIQARTALEGMRTKRLSASIESSFFASSSDRHYEQLRAHVTSAFAPLGLFADSAPDPALVLAEVEKRMDLMMAEWQRVDADARAAAEKAKDTEKRARMRVEYMQQQKREDEERVARSQARANNALANARNATQKPAMQRTFLKQKDRAALESDEVKQTRVFEALVSRFFSQTDD